MSHWNHRILKETLNEDDFYSIHEVFYNSDNTIYAHTQEPVDVNGYSIDEIRETLQWMLTCLDKPVLIAGEVVFKDHAIDYSDIEDDNNETVD